MSGDIEFLPEEFDDEPAEPETPPRRTSRLVWAARAAVVAAAVAGLAVWVGTRPATTPQPAAAPPPPTATHQITHDAKIVTCAVVAPVADEVTRAMDRSLRGITINNLVAHRCVAGAHQRVVSEVVGGSYKGVRIEIDLSQRSGDLPPILHTMPSSGLRHRLRGAVETESAGVKVRVSVYGRSGANALLGQLSDLAEYLSLNIAL